MKALIMDIEGEGTGLDLAIRGKEAGHEVLYWLPPHQTGVKLPYGKGLVERSTDWRKDIEKADLIVFTGNSRYENQLLEYFAKGYPIFGPNPKGAELELDRAKGQEVLEKHGIETAPYHVVDSLQDAIDLIVKTNTAYAIKPWGGEGDKSLTYVASTPDDAIFTLQKWKRNGNFKGQLMLQEKIDGIEMGISGFFGPGGWCAAVEESFEHKKFMNDELGENTGEMGTVIRHTDKSKLFDIMLEPLTDYLHTINYIGDCGVNCIIDSKGKPWPLEFTMRLGWPDFCIRQAVIKADPLEWMLALVQGQDEFRVSTKVAIGVLLAHGDFPRGGDVLGTWEGYPIYGITNENYDDLHFQQVRDGEAPFVVGRKLRTEKIPVTAGNYVMVVTGTGGLVSAAQKSVYKTVDEISIPSNLMYRTDIGKRLKDELDTLHKLGFALGMDY
jgi:phosphoribosylamine--glycine ligase